MTGQYDIRKPILAQQIGLTLTCQHFSLSKRDRAASVKLSTGDFFRLCAAGVCLDGLVRV